MKRVLLAVGMALALSAAPMAAQTRVSVAVGFGVPRPYVTGVVILGVTVVARVSRPGGLPRARSTMSVACGSRYRKCVGRSRVARPRAKARSPDTSRVDQSSLLPPLIYIATVRISRDHFLPPDPNAFLAAEPATGRVVVIAPTRAACETIELAMSLASDTLLARQHGDDISRLAASGRGR